VGEAADDLQVRAPYTPLRPHAVRAIVVRAAHRADLSVVTAHRLRHSAATAMLREGASLSEIAAVLRHRNLATTAIYAKVASHVLRVELHNFRVNAPDRALRRPLPRSSSNRSA
jgi:site-specific recombinase XerD